MSESLFLSVKQVWEEINRDSTASNFSEEILLHNKLLNFFHVGDYYYYIFNVASIQIEFVQDQMMTILGYAKEDFTPENIVANIHPDDLIHFVNFENTNIIKLITGQIRILINIRLKKTKKLFTIKLI